MMDHFTPPEEPTLNIGGLRVWVHGRENPDAYDYDDGNWLLITAHCTASGASVHTEGAFLRTPDFIAWAEECAALYDSLDGEAELRSYEPNLRVKLWNTDEFGHFKMRVEITPDHTNQLHHFEFRIDRSDLPTVIRTCRDLADTYPVRGFERQPDQN